MFANLIANSLDARTVKEAHPSFVDIIKSLSPDEGRILKLFMKSDNFPLIDIRVHLLEGEAFKLIGKNQTPMEVFSMCESKDLIPSYINNLCRLGLLEIPSDRKLHDSKLYDKIVKDFSLHVLENVQKNGATVDFYEKMIEPTDIGKLFIKACVVDKKYRK